MLANSNTAEAIFANTRRNRFVLSEKTEVRGYTLIPLHTK